jgi:hypothetical protein
LRTRANSQSEYGEEGKGSAERHEAPDASQEAVSGTEPCEDSSSEHPVPVIQIIPLIRGSVSTMIDASRNQITRSIGR